MTKKVMPKRGDVYWVALDPTVGREIKKNRPGVIISPNIANEESDLVIVAPITSSIKQVHPFQVRIMLKGHDSKILLNQVRTVDKMRLGKKIDSLDEMIMRQVDRSLKIALGIS